ncbi:MAG: hypothetical protein NZ585_12510 [Chloracidobacterium sp.]|nr:hypothetical protein [Chloracidobacterium sp.]MDW8216248.1 hypothetical protein [Acidobacteriota bacterium]
MTGIRFKDVVGWTLPDAQARLGDLGWRPEARPAAFRYATFGEGDRLMRVTADGWQVAEGKLCARYARIQTVAADVATLMVYPTASPTLLPVFACEWVVIGNRAHILVLDVECIGGADALRGRAHAVLTPLQASYVTALPPAPDPPPWFGEIREAWALFTSGDLSCLPVMRQAFQDYLTATAEALYRPWLAEAQVGPDHPAVTTYKQHHAAHSPGYALLAPKAGADWANAFLREWHFGPVRAVACDWTAG